MRKEIVTYHEQNSRCYNDAGTLTSDAGRRIAWIDYDLNGNPLRIQFTNGSVTKYVYSATGEKLRAIHQTAIPNISVPEPGDGSLVYSGLELFKTEDDVIFE